MENIQIISGNTVVARYENENLDIVRPDIIPLFLKNTGNVKKWLENRAIDSHRTNSRLLKRILRISGLNDIDVVLSVHAVSITDSYWVKKEGESLVWDDVLFKENLFDMVALKGSTDAFDAGCSPTPELTNTGSYEKCWKKTATGWTMLKHGTPRENFSEVFIYCLGKELSLDMAEYFYSDTYGAVMSPDFTRGAVNFEPAEGITGCDETDFMGTYEFFRNINSDMAGQYLNILYMDAVCMNYDRHIQNYGILRNRESGAVLGMAPNYDNNNALLKNDMLFRGEISTAFLKDYRDVLHYAGYEFPAAESLRHAISSAYDTAVKQFPESMYSEFAGEAVIADFILRGHGYLQTV